MKKIFLFILSLISFTQSFSQIVVNRSTNENTVQDARASVLYNLFIPRYADTTTASLVANIGADSCGALIFCYSDGNVYVRKCSPLKYWAAIGSGSGGGFTTATNGLTASTATNVQLGGDLLRNTTVSGVNLYSFTGDSLTAFIVNALGGSANSSFRVSNDGTIELAGGLARLRYQGDTIISDTRAGYATNINGSMTENSWITKSYFDSLKNVGSVTTASQGLFVSTADVQLGSPTEIGAATNPFTSDRYIQQGANTVYKLTMQRDISGFGPPYTSFPFTYTEFTRPAVFALKSVDGGSINNYTFDSTGVVGSAFPGTNYYSGGMGGSVGTLQAFTGLHWTPALGDTHYDIVDLRGSLTSAQIQSGGVGLAIWTTSGETYYGLQGSKRVGINKTTNTIGAMLDVNGTFRVSDSSTFFSRILANTDSIYGKRSDGSLGAIHPSAIIGAATAWNSITDPTGDQALTFGAGESSTWTNQNTTEDLLTINTSTLTTSSLFSLNSTSTVLASGNNLAEFVMSGANGTNGITATGVRISVTNTNVTGTNIGLNVTASGATTLNRAIDATGDVLIQPAVTSGSLNSSGIRISPPSVTTGTVLYISEQFGNTLTTGTLFHINSASTAKTGTTGTAANISTSGANSTSAVTVTALTVSATNTNATSGTNIGLNVTATGATTANVAAQFTAPNGSSSGLAIRVPASSGRVAIGQASANAALDVVGTAILDAIQTSSTGGNSNFFVVSATGAAGNAAAPLQVLGGTSTQFRVATNGTTSTTLTASQPYFTHIIGASVVTEAGSGTHQAIGTLALRAPTITAGAGAVTTGVTFYIEGATAPAGATAYAMWIDAGLSRIDEGIDLNGASSPLQLNTSAGTSGQLLTSAGAGATPTWTSTSALTGLPYRALTGTSTFTGNVTDAAAGFNYTMSGVGAMSFSASTTVSISADQLTVATTSGADFSGGSATAFRLLAGVSSFGDINADGNSTVFTLDDGAQTYNFSNATATVTIANLAGTGSRAVIASATGELSAPVSDRSVKKNVEALNYGLDKVMQLRPVSFEYIDGWNNYGKGTQVGFIAQDVQRVLPNSVFTTPTTGKLGINTIDVIPILVAGMQTQQKQIEELKAEIQKLKRK